MGDILQHKLGVKIEYAVGHDEMKIDLEGSDGNYYAKLDEMMINPRIVDLHNLDIKKEGVKMDFNAPIICNLDNFDSSKSLMGGVKFEGRDKFNFIQKIEETAKSFGPEWEAAVLRRKAEIQKRNSVDK